MKSFEELDAWGKAHGMVLAVNRASGDFLKEERFGVIAPVEKSGGFRAGQYCGRVRKKVD